MGLHIYCQDTVADSVLNIRAYPEDFRFCKGPVAVAPGSNVLLCCRSATKPNHGDWARNSLIILRSFSSLIRVRRRSPSFLMVSGRSKGRLSYIFPPSKWQGMHFDLKIGFTSLSKSIRLTAATWIVSREVEFGTDRRVDSPDSISNNPTPMRTVTIRMSSLYAHSIPDC